MTHGCTPSVARTPSLRLKQGAIGAVAAVMAMTSGPAWSQDAGISMIRDAEIEGILHKDADPVLAAAGLEPSNVEIHLVNNKELNAFVSGGQHIFLFTGMIIKTESPNQLIGVIAHETGHISGGHLARQGEGTRGAMATYAITLGLGLLAALAGGESSSGAAAGMLYSANYFATLQMLGYSRTQESAADQAAAGFLEKAGLSGKGLVSFFDNFRYQEVFSDSRRDAYFRSHPLSSDRIEALRAKVERQPHYNTADTPEAIERHKVMVAKLKAFINYPQVTFADYPETDTSFPARYARAIARYKDLDTERALKDIDALIADQPNNPYLWELKGQVLFEAGRAAESEAPYRKSVELAPTEPLLRISLGQTLLAVPKDAGVAEAITHLNRAADYEPDNPFTWRLLAEAYERNKQPGLARLATAEQSFSLGKLPEARRFALNARDLLEQGTPQYRRAMDIITTSEDNFQGRRRRRS
jgi:predicted Zn-dependent protease